MELRGSRGGRVGWGGGEEGNPRRQAAALDARYVVWLLMAMGSKECPPRGGGGVQTEVGRPTRDGDRRWGQ